MRCAALLATVLLAFPATAAQPRNAAMSGTVEELIGRLEQRLAQLSPDVELPRPECRPSPTGRTCHAASGVMLASATESDGRVTQFEVQLPLRGTGAAELQRQQALCDAMLAVIEPGMNPIITRVWRERMRGAAAEFRYANVATLTRTAPNGGAFTYRLTPRVSVVCSLSQSG